MVGDLGLPLYPFHSKRHLIFVCASHAQPLTHGMLCEVLRSVLYVSIWLLFASQSIESYRIILQQLVTCSFCLWTGFQNLSGKKNRDLSASLNLWGEVTFLSTRGQARDPLGFEGFGKPLVISGKPQRSQESCAMVSISSFSQHMLTELEAISFVSCCPSCPSCPSTCYKWLEMVLYKMLYDGRT